MIFDLRNLMGVDVNIRTVEIVVWVKWEVDSDSSSDIALFVDTGIPKEPVAGGSAQDVLLNSGGRVGRPATREGEGGDVPHH